MLGSLFDTLMARIANSLKYRAGVPLDIRNRIEEAFFRAHMTQKTLEDIEKFISLIAENYRLFDISYSTKLQDGCYPLLRRYDYMHTLAISVGVGNNILIDIALSKKGSKVWLFDHTVSGLPSGSRRNSNLTFYGFGLGCKSEGNLLELKDMIALAVKESGIHKFSVLKVDCEGCEWAALNSIDVAEISKFDQVVIEFHNLNNFVEPSFAAEAISIFTKLTDSFDIAYISPNNFGGSIVLPDMRIWPFTIEVLFIRKIISKSHLSEFPSNLSKLRNWRLGKDIDISNWV